MTDRIIRDVGLIALALMAMLWALDV